MNINLQPTPFAEVNVVLNEFRERLSGLLGDHWQGLYVIGSLALGDFDMQHSDIDMLVVTDGAIEDALFDELAKIHADFAAQNPVWAGRVEAVYVPRVVLNGTGDDGSLQYAQIERGTALFKAKLEKGWVFQCWTLRERGVVVAGPDPRTFVQPANRDEMRRAIAAMSGGWLQESRQDAEWLVWLRQRENQIFVIQTLCRMLYSLRTGAVASKPAAAQWVQHHLGDPWAEIIAAALAGQGDILPDEEAATLAFIAYTVEVSRMGNGSDWGDLDAG